MEFEKDMNCKKIETENIKEELEKDGKITTELSKDEQEKSESVFNVEEYSALKEKVENYIFVFFLIFLPHWSKHDWVYFTKYLNVQ